jgi:hypothetical protein
MAQTATLNAAQMNELLTKLGVSHQELAAQVGCGASQMWKYVQEGLPPRMNREVRAAILEQATQCGVLPQNAATRSHIAKLTKGR